MGFDIDIGLKDLKIKKEKNINEISNVDFKELKETLNNSIIDNEKILETLDLSKISPNDLIFQSLTEDGRNEVLYNQKIKFLYDNLGIKLGEFLNDKKIIEIRLNQDGSIWTEQFGVGVVDTGVRLTTIEGNRILQLIADFNKTTISIDKPRISAVLPNGERFEGLTYIPTGFKPIFVIRKKSDTVFTLDDYVKFGVINEEIKEYLIKTIQKHKNILVVGGTSSGKTTFCNGLLNELSDSPDRIIILEDTKELVCSAKDRVELVSSDFCSMKELLVSCMRLTPTRIMVGELRRGEESLDLLKAWNSGHSGGFCTIHANNALAGLHKLGMYLDEVTKKPQEMLIGQSIDVVISLIKTKDFRRVLVEILELDCYDKVNKEYKVRQIYKNPTVSDEELYSE